jgi:hypothetical protein
MTFRGRPRFLGGEGVAGFGGLSITMMGNDRMMMLDEEEEMGLGALRLPATGDETTASGVYSTGG